MADTSETTSTWGGLIEMPQHQAIQVVLLGIGLGIGSWILGMLVKQIILVPLFCGDPASAACISAPGIGVDIASVIVALIGLMGLVRLGIYRPLLIVIATLLSLWGLGNWTMKLEWYEVLAWSIILYALCYIAFAWLVRPRSFVPMAIIVVAAVILIRWLPIL